MKRNKIVILLTAILFVSFFSAIASEETHGEAKKFEPGPFILNHIGDAYDWHIADIGGKPIGIPLPIILYSEHSGFHVFMYTKFDHGHKPHLDFSIANPAHSEGIAETEAAKLEQYKGKIVETLASGEIYRPYDFSITKNVLSLFISLVLLLWLFLSVAKSYKKRAGQAPTGVQNAMETLIVFVRDDVVKPAIGDHKYMRYLPFLLSVFFFILINNLMGLIPIFPGGANLTGNISITLVLALFVFVITSFSGNKAYWTHIINAPGVPLWLKIPIPLMPIVEIIGVITKPFVLMVRLFANITAGHIIALGFFSLIFIFGGMHWAAGYGISILSVGFTIFMSILEVLVAFIQAYVFTLLSALYFGMATEEHHH